MIEFHPAAPPALETLHHEKQLSLVFADFMDCTDVGMVERAPVASQLFGKEFQGDEAMQPSVLGRRDNAPSVRVVGMPGEHGSEMCSKSPHNACKDGFQVPVYIDGGRSRIRT